MRSLAGFNSSNLLLRTKLERILVLISNNGGEYTSTYFKDLYKKEGIKTGLTISYNPQHSRVVERKNQSIISDTKDMIHDHYFLMFLQEEACNTTVYI